MLRRTFLQAIGAIPLAGCLGDARSSGDENDPRLRARPGASTALTLATGETQETVGGTEFVAYLPASAASRTSIPLLVFLHGAGRDVATLIAGIRPLADHAGIMLLFPSSRGGTWDAIAGTYGPDRAGIDRALDWVFARAPIDAGRLVLAGFSDGASYALGLGRANGDLFTKLLAFSPGMLLPTVPVGRPPIVITHGTEDTVLSHENTETVIVPALRAEGHAVEFVSFEGEHAMPTSVLLAEVTALGA